MANFNIKFDGVNLLETMGSIVEAHTVAYKSDFDLDRKMVLAAADNTPKTFLWLCRTHGTWLLDERSTYVRNTFEYNTFTFYADNHIDGILAYAVEVTGRNGDTVLGTLYALNYEQHVSHVHAAALEPSTLALTYQRGTRYVRGDMRFTAEPDAELGALVSHEYLADEEDWDYLLRLERKSRERFGKGNFGPYLAAI